MLNRIANVCTFLTLALLTAILWLVTVAVYDFNHRGNNIFVREWEQHANYTVGEIEGNLVGYQVHYQTCGQTNIKAQEALLIGQESGIGDVITPPSFVYGRIEKQEHVPFWTYHSISKEDVKRLGLDNLDKSQKRPAFEWGSGTRRVCQVNPTGILKATGSFIRSLT